MSNDVNNSSMLREGTMLHGTYRVDGYLASGGFGNAYVATNIEFNERYAIKEFFWHGVSQRDNNSITISVSNSENQEAFTAGLNKFKKEARRLRKLSNKHIVHVYDLFEENGTAYYVMDYIDGESLKVKMERLGHPLSESEVMNVFDQVLDALTTAHGAGILHLDIKPSNIMVNKQGNATLIDFGASKQQSLSGGATASTAISRTPGYAPREQMEENPDKFGPWTDFYALGATLYNLLTGKKPPLSSDIDDDETSDKHVALPMPSSVSNKTKSLVLWLMNTNRKRRPQSVDQIRNYLGENAAPSYSTTVNQSSSANTDDESTQVINNNPTPNVIIPSTSSKKDEGAIGNAKEETPLFAHPFSFHGRIRRTEMWLSCIFAYILLVAFVGIKALLLPAEQNSDGVASIIILLYVLLWIWLTFFQGAKRCHDIGDSGWWQLVPFYSLLQLLKRGNKGPNKHGDDPKDNVGSFKAMGNFFKNNKGFTIGLIVLFILGCCGIATNTRNSNTAGAINTNVDSTADSTAVVDSLTDDYADTVAEPSYEDDTTAAPAEDADQVW